MWRVPPRPPARPAADTLWLPGSVPALGGGGRGHPATGLALGSAKRGPRRVNRRLCTAPRTACSDSPLPEASGSAGAPQGGATVREVRRPRAEPPGKKGPTQGRCSRVRGCPVRLAGDPLAGLPAGRPLCWMYPVRVSVQPDLQWRLVSLK